MEIALDREDTDMVVLLSKAIGQEIPDDAKIRQLSSLMYQEDQEKAKKEFRELLETLPSKLVSSEQKIRPILRKVAETSLNCYGSVLQDAVLEGKTDFICLLLQHGWALVSIESDKFSPLWFLWLVHKHEYAFIGLTPR